jgi:hypothetical protein
VSSFDPEAVRVSAHALERYCERRRTKPEFAEEGVRRLLRRAAAQPLSPARTEEGRSGRQVMVGEFKLTLSVDCGTLITLARVDRVNTWKGLKRAKRGRRRPDV